MNTDDLPPDVQQFIAGRITSVMQLEVLLFLEARASQVFTVSALAKQFLVDPGWVEHELGELASQGLLECNDTGVAGGPSYRYCPSSTDLDNAVSGLARAYENRRVTVTTLIYSKPIDNIRVFADAFRFRKD